MVLKAAAPIVGDDGSLIGVLYGGHLINQNFELVDEIKATVYQNASYHGKSEGTATIFQGNLRISTNVMDLQGERAIGTQVSSEVHEQVLDRGERWIDRAFVVNVWFITAYEPIKNITGDVIGILYVGMLEQRFTDMQRNTIFMLLGITMAGSLLDEELPPIVVDGPQIQEVFLNIILNAIDAMPQGGELRVTSSMKNDPCVQIRFADTGCGVSPEHIDKVFDPFFTTKDASKGTGLGLAVAYGIIEKHHGEISMESEVGRGATCIIDLSVNASA
jgi:sensor histidine kinase regulating citrate/malate metabolism